LSSVSGRSGGAVPSRRRPSRPAGRRRVRTAGPGCGGLCPKCSYRRRTEILMQEAVDLAVVVPAGLSDGAAIAELTRRCETDTPAMLALACERDCGPDAGPSWGAFTEPAVAHADAVYEACLRRRGRGAEETAEQAADAASRRTAELVLRQRLGALHAAHERAARALRPWAEWRWRRHDRGRSCAIACVVCGLCPATLVPYEATLCPVVM
jgi:hypothetical protein